MGIIEGCGEVEPTNTRGRKSTSLVEYDAAHGLVRLTKNEASMCQFVHKRKGGALLQARLLARHTTTIQCRFRLSPFCGVQQPQHANVDHWEMLSILPY